MIRYLCNLKTKGFIAKKQDYSSIYTTFTQLQEDAKSYKTKQGAARALNYKSWESEIGKKIWNSLRLKR